MNRLILFFLKTISLQYAVESQVEFHGYDPKTAMIEIEPRKVGVYSQIAFQFLLIF